MKASNFEVHVIGNELEHLRHAILLAGCETRAIGWMEDNGWLVLYWSATKVSPLPLEMDAEAMLGLVLSWLKERWKSPRTDAPDIDGSCKWRGFEVASGYCTLCAVLDDGYNPYEILRVRPVWAEYHK